MYAKQLVETAIADSCTSSEIDDVLRDQSNAIEGLHHLVQVLCDRLNPIQRPTNPREDKTGATPAPMRSGLGHRIETHTESIYMVNRKITEMTESLAI